MGLLLQDIDSMVSITMTIDREIDDAWSIRDAVPVRRGRRTNLL